MSPSGEYCILQRVNECNRPISTDAHSFGYCCHGLAIQGETIDYATGSNLEGVLQTAKLIHTADLNGFSCAMTTVVFTVLACCMTTLGYHHAAISVELPTVTHSVAIGGLTWGANRHNAMIVTVTRDGSIFMTNGRVVGHSVLTGKIKSDLSEGAEKKLYIKADAHAPFSSVKTVLEAAQSVDVHNVSFFTFR
jgi:biopolymer transport protein ExbD